jgi:hypothetical protein|tara:strand:- start:218 stop:691 length:474 start_codon:yes stop_codon:yes gene_type:complete
VSYKVTKIFILLSTVFFTYKKGALMKEDDLQKYVIQWLEIALPDNSVYHHSPNEGVRHVAFRRRLKAMGMAAGWPDIELFVPKDGWRFPNEKAGIFIELKAKKGRMTESQKAIQRCLRMTGEHVETCYSLDQVKLWLQTLLQLKDNPRMQIIERMCP